MEIMTKLSDIEKMITTAENGKLLSRANVQNKRQAILAETRSQLSSDYKAIRRLIPSNNIDQVFSFFYYLRTQSVSPVSGAKEMYDYFQLAINKGIPITILTWDCPGCAEPYLINNEITRDPLDTIEGARATLVRRRFVTRSEVALDLLKIVEPLKQQLPINFRLITAGLNALTYYPKSAETFGQKKSALKAVKLFTQEYQSWVNSSFGEMSFPVNIDLDVYPIKAGSKYWSIYKQIIDGQIPIPDFILQKQMEINQRITEPLGLDNTPQASLLARRVIAAYGAEGVILDDLEPKFGNIIIAATEAISVYFQRSNFARRFLGLKPIPTFYTLYE